LDCCIELKKINTDIIIPTTYIGSIRKYLIMEYIMEIEKVKIGAEILGKSSEFAAIIPEVNSNLVMALEGADKIDQVVGIPGRIIKINGLAKTVMEPDFMSSSHMARLVLSIMKHNPSLRSAINVLYDPVILDICEKLGLKISSYDRAYEPPEIRDVEGGTIPWGVETAIEKLGEIPDIIYHEGAWGKEPMICIVGIDAVEVAEMAVCIAKLYDIQKDKPELTEKFSRESSKYHDTLFAPSRKKWKEEKLRSECIFCSIADGNEDIEERVLYNDEVNMVLMNIFPYSRGHLIVLPVKHQTDLNELNPEEVKNLFCVVQRSISLIKDVIKPDGINIGINLGKAAGATIQHLHIHLVPRFKYESGFMETTANTRVIEEDIDITYSKFTEKLDILRNHYEV
jgi:predicted fused transcriptional regulator/phosphomethylpyrimidine kinase/diadenosine tetraphosphate (Ap4A) HIT family hydrolase